MHSAVLSKDSSLVYSEFSLFWLYIFKMWANKLHPKLIFPVFFLCISESNVSPLCNYRNMRGRGGPMRGGMMRPMAPIGGPFKPGPP